MFLFLALAAAASTDAIAVTASGDVYGLDSTHGSVALLNSTGLPMHCLARRGDGRLWTLADLGGGIARLVEIDPLSGGTSTLLEVDLGGVAHGAGADADGSLYLLVRPIVGGPDRLMLFNPSSSFVNLVGSTGLSTLEDLCVSPEGRVYAWDVGVGGGGGLGLVELSRQNGLATDIAAHPGSSDVLALAVDEFGELRGANAKVYSISRATGVDSPTTPNTQISIEGFQFLAGMSRIDGALALERTGVLKRVNTTTGAVGPAFGALSGEFVAATYRHTTPQMGEYLVMRDAGSTTEILSVDPSTGASTSLGMANVDGVLAFYYAQSTSNTLQIVTDGGPGQDDLRHVLSLPSLFVTPGSPLTGFSDVRSVAVEGSLRYIGWDETRGFFSFAHSMASTPEDLTSGTANLANVSEIQRDPHGRLLGSDGALQRFFVMTEGAAPIGSPALGELVGFNFTAHPQVQAPLVYCASSLNSAGCTSGMITGGPVGPSVSEPSGFELLGVQQVPDKQGLLFYGVNGRNNAPFSSGFLCVKSPLRRSPILNSGGSGGCTGRFEFDFNAWMASGVDPSLVAGRRVNSQFWSRDPAAPSTTNVSRAVEFEIAP